MPELYRDKIHRLICKHPLGIDPNIEIHGKPPASASSEFLTNKEQGDWAEKLVLSSINKISDQYIAVQYGRADTISAGDPGFSEFYKEYQNELNNIGKRPDVLIFKRSDISSCEAFDYKDEALISKAILAIEVRSSSFLSEKYAKYMDFRCRTAEDKCLSLTREVLTEPYGSLLKNKNKDIYLLLKNATRSTFRELDFRANSWTTSPELCYISSRLKKLKDNIKLLHKRDFLSVTPKVEDLALVNRWIQRYNVPHYYLQVFFDRGYIVPFEEILTISSNSDLEGTIFSVEKDVKNQGKTTIKIDINKTLPVIGRITMPRHYSALKELDRGRLLFYVKFTGGEGFLDVNIFNSLLKNHERD